ncbi:NgoPII family restriction endonuclease [Merismopedia glauca]|uniref:Restriction endonuclease n=1 Tax=Merismopedia glauca CCAP 1448/3 TaxID=1296344 RepID=A0A2T1C852_9CYAN|nr:NgoPII family restriction endonuclease [Merismopedia glauca]PSB04404.1 restriction endonuclease [Merismopedia glauca CCAP 1448/3]
MTDILQAIATLVNRPIPNLLDYYRSKSQNRINAVGDALEEYIKDIFADTIDETNLDLKNNKYNQVFSWQGSQNNPPDLIIRNGDALEVKKIGTIGSQIALNSFFPKAKLFSNDLMISSDCRNCETWTAKDLVYAIGVTSHQKLNLLWLIYGDCYAASQEYYTRIKNTIATGISAIDDVNFSQTKELGRVNKVDPLEITYLRIRGMWGIQNPLSAYNYLNLYDANATFQLIAIVKETKYLSFPTVSRNTLEALVSCDRELIINIQNIKSPDNPKQIISAKIINYKMR